MVSGETNTFAQGPYVFVRSQLKRCSNTRAEMEEHLIPSKN